MLYRTTKQCNKRSGFIFNKECVSQGISGFSRYFTIFYRTFPGFSSCNTKFFLQDEDKSHELELREKKKNTRAVFDPEN
jgi:hypothetical protein